MHYPSLSAAIKNAKRHRTDGPIALLLAEDAVEFGSTLARLDELGFAHIYVFCTFDLALPDSPTPFRRVDAYLGVDGALQAIVNGMIGALPDQWIYYGFNAEYLFYPFCEDRSVAEVCAFMEEERRDSVMSTIIDLYARDLGAHPSGVDRDSACFDAAGHYAVARLDADGNPLDRQVDLYGGLRWRFEEHIPRTRQRIDRVCLFRARPGLQMLADRTFNLAEYNTYACPWHHSLTAAVCSFRTAKALRRNPGSRAVIDTFHWPQSQRFSWHGQQLLDLGMMEPGQWF